MEVLQPLPEVARVDLMAQVDGVVDLMVRSANGRNITAEVGAALRAHQIGIEELSSERGRLDDVFRTITSVP
jgi:glycine cleavage system regulatory protein